MTLDMAQEQKGDFHKISHELKVLGILLGGLAILNFVWFILNFIPTPPAHLDINLTILLILNIITILRFPK